MWENSNRQIEKTGPANISGDELAGCLDGSEQDGEITAGLGSPGLGIEHMAGAFIVIKTKVVVNRKLRVSKQLRDGYREEGLTG